MQGIQNIIDSETLGSLQFFHDKVFFRGFHCILGM